MPSALFSKFNAFVENVAEKVHNLQSDTLTVALTPAANPPSAANAVLADITQITDYTKLSSRNVVVTSSAQSGGVYKLIANPLVLTASASGTPTFRYVVLYNSTASGGPLIAWWDYGSPVTMNASDTLTITFDATNGVLQLT